MPIQLPFVTSPVIDFRNGLINRDWYMAFLSIAGTTTGAFVAAVNISGNNGITVTGTPITTNGTITLGIGNLTCASAVISGGVTANSVAVVTVVNTAALVATGSVSSAIISTDNATVNGTVTSARAIIASTITASAVVATSTSTAVNIIATGTLTAINVVTTGTIFPSTTLGIAGTGTNDNASAGRRGEYQDSQVLAAANVGLSNNTPADITSLSLSGGDWDVWGTVAMTLSGATVVTNFIAWSSVTSATLPTAPNFGGENFLNINFPAGSSSSLSAGRKRFPLTTTTTVVLSTQVAFTLGGAGAYGFLGARRAR